MGLDTLTKEEFQQIVKLHSIKDCKAYLNLMLDFYFDVMNGLQSYKPSSQQDYDCQFWIQSIFLKSCTFKDMLEGTSYRRNGTRLSPIIDFNLLFTVARRVYESVISFELLFVVPDTDEKKVILHNLFMSAGLSERLKNIDEEMCKKHPKRVESETNAIQECVKAIEETALYTQLDVLTKNVIQNAIKSHRYRYVFQNDNILKFVKLEEAYIHLRVREDIYKQLYSYMSLNGHPSYLALIQFREAFEPTHREDMEMANFATQCLLSFMSIFIVDYMKIIPEAKCIYNKLSKVGKFAIGMYEDTMRGEQKFKD